MATSKESDLSQEFIRNQKLIHGSNLFIEKHPAFKIGEPDIYGIYRGMPFHAESKNINELTLKNLHPFKEIQIENLTEKAKAGACCIGLLLMHNKYKFMYYDKLHAYITSNEYQESLDFDFELLRQEWLKRIL